MESNATKNALSLMKEGKIYDLAGGWWRHMPMHPAHPAFDVYTCRTQWGEHHEKDLAFLDGETIGYGFNSELIMFTTHTGTHIDAMCHIVSGEDPACYGEHKLKDFYSDHGYLTGDATELPLIARRGIMLDMPKALGFEEDVLPANYPIGPNELEKACKRQNVRPEEGDAILIRTGQMKFWRDDETMAKYADSGLNLAGAEWVASFKPIATGTDTVAYDVWPSGIPGNPQPCHNYLIRTHGIPIMEWIYQEGLAKDSVYEFMFIALPLNIKGATGSLLRPVAIV